MKRAVVSSAVLTPMGTCLTEASLIWEGHKTQQQRAPLWGQSLGISFDLGAKMGRSCPYGPQRRQATRWATWNSEESRLSP